MQVVRMVQGVAWTIQRTRTLSTQRNADGSYDYEGDGFGCRSVQPVDILILPDDVEVAEGDEITDELIGMAQPHSLFERATKEQAAADALGLLLRASIAEGVVTDEELLRIAPALEEREWKPGLDVIIGDVYAHEGAIWHCVAAHTTQADWLPPTTPALWRKVEKATDGPRVWQSVTDYQTDDEVHYPDAHSPLYRCVLGHMSQEGWEPPNVPALWVACVEAELPPEE